MQVKKFEAKTMKDALQLVKNHMGPDAVILTVKDIHNSFGVAGQKSVQVTAVVAEDTLQKKRMVEAKLNEQTKSKFQNIPARKQKEFINKVFNQYENKTQARPMTRVRYIDIDEEQVEATTSTTLPVVEPVDAKQTIKMAAKNAYEAFVEHQEPARASVSTMESEEVLTLRREIAHLKSLLNNFQKMPQNIISMHPGADLGLPYELSFIFKKLNRAGINQDQIIRILNMARGSLSVEQLKKKALIDGWVAKFLLSDIEIADQRYTDRRHIFMGPVGQGKTSSLIKFASQLVIKEKKKVAIVTADTKKVGAVEQLKIYASILHIPFMVIQSHTQWESIDSQLLSYDHVLVDSPGLNLKTMGEVDYLRALLSPAQGRGRVHYVQSVLAKDDVAFDTAERYRGIGFDDVIFTGLDESAQHGLIYNFQKKFECPLHSFGIGPNMPEDYELATKERVIDLLFKLTKIKKEREGHL